MDVTKKRKMELVSQCNSMSCSLPWENLPLKTMSAEDNTSGQWSHPLVWAPYPLTMDNKWFASEYQSSNDKWEAVWAEVWHRRGELSPWIRECSPEWEAREARAGAVCPFKRPLDTSPRPQDLSWRKGSPFPGMPSTRRRKSFSDNWFNCKNTPAFRGML